MSLNQIISISENFSLWLHQHTNYSEFKRITIRELSAIALFQQAIDIEDGIRVLIENNLPGPAFSLARPLFECYVRGFWLLNKASDDEVKEFRSGKHHPKFNISNLIDDIGDNLETGGAWIKGIKDEHLKVMHDLTHGGTSHISPRCSSDMLEPRYPEFYKISLMVLGLEIKIRIGAELLAKKMMKML